MQDKAFLVAKDPDGNVPLYLHNNRLTLISCLSEGNTRETLRDEVQKHFHTELESIEFAHHFNMNNNLGNSYLVHWYLGDLKKKPETGIYLPSTGSPVQYETDAVLEEVAAFNLVPSLRNYKRAR